MLKPKVAITIGDPAGLGPEIVLRGNYYISNSFYDEDRLTSISYASKIDNNVLLGMKLPKEDVVTTSTGYAFWAQEKAAKYHDPLFKAFLDTYCR